MKKPEEYLREAELIVKDKSIDEMFALNLTRDGYRSSLKTILRVIKQAQIDSYNKALEDAVESVELDEVCRDSEFAYNECNTMENDYGDVYAINSDSILKLKK